MYMSFGIIAKISMTLKYGISFKRHWLVGQCLFGGIFLEENIVCFIYREVKKFIFLKSGGILGA